MLLNVVKYGVVELRYKTFIACDPVSTGNIPGIIDIFAGDNRNFGYAATPSRSFQSYHVSVNSKMVAGPMTDGVRGTKAYFGQTLGYNDELANVGPCPPGQVCPSFCTDCITPTAITQCTDTAESGMNENDLSAVLTHVDESLTEVQFDLTGFNPCVSGAPGIDAQITFEFRQVYDSVTGLLGPFEWRIKPDIDSWHDEFPWHELYLNAVQVYTFDPCIHPGGPNANNLIDHDPLFGEDDDINLNVPGDVQPQNNDIRQWQEVP